MGQTKMTGSRSLIEVEWRRDSYWLRRHYWPYCGSPHKIEEWLTPLYEIERSLDDGRFLFHDPEAQEHLVVIRVSDDDEERSFQLAQMLGWIRETRCPFNLEVTNEAELSLLLSFADSMVACVFEQFFVYLNQWDY